MKTILSLLIILSTIACQKESPEIENIQISCYQQTLGVISGYFQLENKTKYREYYRFSAMESHDNLTPPKAESYILHFEREGTNITDFHIETFTTDGNVMRHLTFYPRAIEGKLVIHEVLNP